MSWYDKAKIQVSQLQAEQAEEKAAEVRATQERFEEMKRDLLPHFHHVTAGPLAEITNVLAEASANGLLVDGPDEGLHPSGWQRYDFKYVYYAGSYLFWYNQADDSYKVWSYQWTITEPVTGHSVVFALGVHEYYEHTKRFLRHDKVTTHYEPTLRGPRLRAAIHDWLLYLAKKEAGYLDEKED